MSAGIGLILGTDWVPQMATYPADTWGAGRVAAGSRLCDDRGDVNLA
jgi:hypothetical protein